MSDSIKDLISIIKSANRNLNAGTNLGYYLEDELIQILITINIYGKPSLRKAEKFAKEHELGFDRNYAFFEGSKIKSERPNILL